MRISVKNIFQNLVVLVLALMVSACLVEIGLRIAAPQEPPCLETLQKLCFLPFYTLKPHTSCKQNPRMAHLGLLWPIPISFMISPDEIP